MVTQNMKIKNHGDVNDSFEGDFTMILQRLTGCHSKTPTFVTIEVNK